MGVSPSEPSSERRNPFNSIAETSGSELGAIARRQHSHAVSTRGPQNRLQKRLDLRSEVRPEVQLAMGVAPSEPGSECRNLFDSIAGANGSEIGAIAWYQHSHAVSTRGPQNRLKLDLRSEVGSEVQLAMGVAPSEPGSECRNPFGSITEANCSEL